MFVLCIKWALYYTKKVITEKVQKNKETIPKTAVFWPQKADFCKNKKTLCASLTFDPKRLYTKFQQNRFTRFAVISLLTDRRTDRRMDRRTDRRTERSTDRRKDRRTGKRTDRRTDRCTHRRTDRCMAGRKWSHGSAEKKIQGPMKTSICALTPICLILPFLGQYSL